MSKIVGIHSNEDIAKTYYDFGTLYRLRKTYTQAISWYEKSLAYKPDGLAHYYKAVCLAYLKQYDEAILAYNESMIFIPSSRVIFLMRGNSYQAQEKYQEALQDYSEAIRLDSKYVDALYNRAFVHNKLKNHKEVIEDCDAVLALNPDYADAYVMRGVVHNALERYADAVLDTLKGLEIEETPLAYTNLGIYYRKLNLFEKSVRAFQDAICISPTYYEAHYGCAVSYSSLKEKEACLYYIGKAISLHKPYQEQARQDDRFAWLYENAQFKKLTRDSEETDVLPKNSFLRGIWDFFFD